MRCSFQNREGNFTTHQRNGDHINGIKTGGTNPPPKSFRAAGPCRSGDRSKQVFIPPLPLSEFIAIYALKTRAELGTFTLNGHTPMYVGAVRGGLGKVGEWSGGSLALDEFVAEDKKRTAQGLRFLVISVYKEFTKID
jgi:hypothetical protein